MVETAPGGYTPGMPAPPVTGERDAEGIFWIRLDDPGRPVNVLSTEAMEALSAVLADAAADAAVRGVVVTSGKPGVFLAGADIRLFETLRTEAEGAALICRLPHKPSPWPPRSFPR